MGASVVCLVHQVLVPPPPPLPPPQLQFLRGPHRWLLDRSGVLITEKERTSKENTGTSRGRERIPLKILSTYLSLTHTLHVTPCCQIQMSAPLGLPGWLVCLRRLQIQRIFHCVFCASLAKTCAKLFPICMKCFVAKLGVDPWWS